MCFSLKGRKKVDRLKQFTEQSRSRELSYLSPESMEMGVYPYRSSYVVTKRSRKLS